MLNSYTHEACSETVVCINYVSRSLLAEAASEQREGGGDGPGVRESPRILQSKLGEGRRRLGSSRGWPGGWPGAANGGEINWQSRPGARRFLLQDVAGRPGR